MIRAIICDDHPVVREGMRVVVNTSKDIVIEDEASTGHQLLEKIRKRKFDVIILDISFPEGLDGIEILKVIRAEQPKAAVLVMSMHSEEQSAVRALRAGAAGYLVKGSMPTEILAAVRKVGTGGKYISPALAEHLAAELEEDRVKPRHEDLSDQEYKTLSLLAAGKSLTGAARELGLSPSTVGTYRSRILHKLGLKTNAEMVRYAVQHHIIE
jgi:two-component system, NarL family, invasion response regulator UvrY